MKEAKKREVLLNRPCDRLKLISIHLGFLDRALQEVRSTFEDLYFVQVKLVGFHDISPSFATYVSKVMYLFRFHF